ncbi:hypothetical protein EV715DRAFT_202413 [Schizophyllum commune]
MRSVREAQTRREEDARMRLQAFEDARARLRSYETSSLDDSLHDAMRDLPESMRYSMRRPSAAGSSAAATDTSSAGPSNAPPTSSAISTSATSTSASSSSVSTQTQRSSSIAEMRARAFNPSRDFMDIPPFAPRQYQDPYLPASISRRQPFLDIPVPVARPPLGLEMLERRRDAGEVWYDYGSSDSWMDHVRPLPVGIEVPTSASAVRGSPMPFGGEPSTTPTGQAAPSTSEGQVGEAIPVDTAGAATVAPTSVVSNEATASGSSRPSEGSSDAQTSVDAQQEQEEVRAMVEDSAPQASGEGSTQVGTDEAAQAGSGAAGQPERGWPRVYRMWYG